MARTRLPRKQRNAPRAPSTTTEPALLPSDQLAPGTASAVLLLGTVAVAGIVGAELWVTKSKLGFPLDDTFIHLRIAENLASGAGFGLNPGESLPASTSPLWVLLLWVPALLGANLMSAALVFSAMSYIVLGYATARLAQRLTRRSDVAWLAGLGALLAGRLVWSSASGMETLTFAVVSLLAVDAAIALDRIEEPKPRGSQVALGVWLGAAALLRPEGTLLVGLFIVSTIVDMPRDAAGNARIRWRPPPVWTLATFVALLAPWVAFCAATTGSPWPTTVGAKMGFLQRVPALEFLASHAREVFESSPLLAIFWPLGLFVALRALLRDFGSRLVISWSLALPIAAAVLLPVRDYHHGRYLMPLLPFAAIVGALGVAWIWEKVARAPAALKPIRRITFLILLAGGGYGAVKFAMLLGANVAEINDLQVHVGLWASQRTPPNARIAACDIGAISYLGKRRILDLAGIATPEVTPLLAGKRLGGEQDAVLWPILVREKPEYLALYPDWYPHITARPDLFEPVYWRKTEARSIAGGDMLVAYKAYWDRYSPTTAISAADARARIDHARTELREGRADAVWPHLLELQAAGPLDRAFRRLLYVAWAEAALTRGDCREARRGVLYLDWLAPPASFRARERLDALEQRAQACKPPR